MPNTTMNRRTLLAAGTGVVAPFFAGKAGGANDRIAAAFIGVGVMGTGNLSNAMKVPGLEVVALCDVFQPNLERAEAVARKAGFQPKAVKDFREILADRSVDVVCISTPDHWHAYMMIEACKAGKDVYVEKPLGCVVDEARKMAEAARKYNRVVQVGTARRSFDHVKKAREIVQSGELGKVCYARTWNLSAEPPVGIGHIPDSPPPPGLDWDLWLGPAPKRPFNQNRFGVDPNRWSTFRYFWDYAGGQLVDNGVHIIDIMHMLMGEPTVQCVSAIGAKKYSQDDRETPDTMQVTLEYPEFIASYDFRYCNGQSMIADGFFPAAGVVLFGEKATLYLDYGGYQVIPEPLPQPALASRRIQHPPPNPPLRVKANGTSTPSHWQNFLDCVRTRKKPIADIDFLVRSNTACFLGNVSMRGRTRVDWDEQTGRAIQSAARPFLTREYRAPWQLTL